MSRLMMLSAQQARLNENRPAVIELIAEMDIGLAGSVVWVADDQLKVYSGISGVNVNDNFLRSFDLNGQLLGKQAVVGAVHSTDITPIPDQGIGYLFGGMLNGSVAQTLVKRVNLASGETVNVPWQFSTSTASYSIRSVYDGENYIYTMDRVGRFGRYNIQTGERTLLQSLPMTTVSGGMMFIFEGEIYHLGGWDANTANVASAVFKYSPSTNSWEIHDTLPAGVGPVNQGQGGKIGNQFCFPYWNGQTIMVCRYDIKRKGVHQTPTGLSYRNMTACTTSDKNLFLVGGSVTGLGHTGYGSPSALVRTIHRVTF